MQLGEPLVESILPHVNDVCPLGHQGEAMGHSRMRIKVAPTIREGIRSDIHHTHNERSIKCPQVRGKCERVPAIHNDSVLALLSNDQTHSFRAGRRIAQLPTDRGRDRASTWFAHTTHGHAEVLTLHHNNDTAWVEHVHQ